MTANLWHGFILFRSLDHLVRYPESERAARDDVAAVVNTGPDARLHDPSVQMSQRLRPGPTPAKVPR